MASINNTAGIIGGNGRRRPMDFYPTPDECTIALLDFLQIPKGETMAEEINRVAWRCAINCAEEIIGHLPSIEAEPVKRGKWIYDNQFDWYRASCSECGYKRVTDIKAEKWNGWKYCPNCGAKMEPISASTENGQEEEE